MFFLKAKCKINLFLHITNKLPNNYHSLQSLACFADDIYDELTIEPNNNYSLNIIGEFSQYLDVDNNIITKIVEFFHQNYNLPHSLKILLNKKIPLGAGLGGGSSNGAIVILAINEIFNLNLNSLSLTNIAMKFGADIPTCMHQRANFFQSMGEITTPIDLPKPLPVIIINPMVHNSTKEVFNNFKSQFTKKINLDSLSFATNEDLISFLRNQHNDLTQSAIGINGVIGEILDYMKSYSPLICNMSGSGSSIFGIYERAEDIQNILPNIKKHFPNYWIRSSYFQ